jgi:thiamine pyrophosphate-dependent acetolactate synthase large subunit-like protein
VKQEQKGLEGVSMRYAGPDLLALGRAFGIRALGASDEPALQSALLAAQTAPGPTLIDARIDASGYRRMLEIVRGVPR